MAGSQGPEKGRPGVGSADCWVGGSPRLWCVSVCRSVPPVEPGGGRGEFGPRPAGRSGESRGARQDGERARGEPEVSPRDPGAGTHPDIRLMWPRSVLQRLRMRMGVPRALTPSATREDTFTSAASCRRPPKGLRDPTLGAWPGCQAPALGPALAAPTPGRVDPAEGRVGWPCEGSGPYALFLCLHAPQRPLLPPPGVSPWQWGRGPQWKVGWPEEKEDGGSQHTHPEPCRPTLVCSCSCTPKPGSSFTDTFGSMSSSIFSLGGVWRGGPLIPRHPQCQSFSAWAIPDQVGPTGSLGCVPHPTCNP